MYYAIVDSEEREDIALCKSGELLAKDTEVEFIMSGNHVYRGFVLECAWCSEDSVAILKILAGIIGKVTARMFRMEMKYTPEEEAENDPSPVELPFYPSDEEPEAAAADEVMGHDE